MKNSVIRIPLFLLFVMISFVSCTVDENVGPDSGDPRDKFIGTWIFNETPAARNIDASYSVTISYDESNSSRVLLRNFGNTGANDVAYGIVTASRITVPSQETAPGATVAGSGDLVTTTSMNWNYTITAGGDLESFTATANK